MALTQSRYERALQAIDAISWRGVQPGLERTLALLEVLGNPHLGLRGVLVAGTNGKGSVSAMTDSVLRAAGMHTVLLTKPHLSSFCERIVIDGADVSEDGFAALIETATAAADTLPDALQPTGFELVTVAGILAAARAGCDVVVCEVGMGGRLDSTNVVDLGVCVITNVALDHREHLGDTIPQIAREKAAIIKPGDVAVTTADEPALGIVAARCDSVHARLVDARDRGRLVESDRDGITVDTRYRERTVRVHAPLIGAFQTRNLLAAVAACEEMSSAFGLRIEEDAVVAGLGSVRWRGRMQWIDGAPPIVVDSAHNPAGVAAAVAAFGEVRDGAPVVALVAAMRDKDARGMVAALEQLSDMRAVVTAPSVQRAMAAEELASLFSAPATAVTPVREALDAARRLAGADGIVLVCGSLFLAGEVLGLLGA